MFLKNLAVAAVASALFIQPLVAKDAKADAPKTKAPKATEVKQDKLLPLMTMEGAFAKALQRRAILANGINQLAAKYQKASEADKAIIKKDLEKLSLAFRTLNGYMDVIYGLGGQRAYEYNRVTSEIFLRVGTVSEVFTRAIATRDALAKQIVTLKDAIDKEKDPAKKKNLETQQAFIVRRYALVVNALYNIFQITPARNYHFDAASRTLFLKTNDAEVAKLREQLKKHEAKAEQKKAEAAKAADKPAKK